MMNMCGRKCWHCGNDGHNSRTCKKGCTEIKLFGVQIAVQSEDDAESTIRKSKSLGNLQSCNSDNTAAAAEPSGYLSDGLVHQSSKSHERKRGKPWSEDEHRSFLAGLEKLGKGDWKGIANNFVHSRSSTQVASHAQKYFNRLSATERKRRRASVFDIPLTHANQASNKADESSLPASSSAAASKNVIESKGQPSKPAPVVTTSSERPPLSPMNRRGIPDYLPSIVYQPRVSSFTKGYPNPTQTTVIPTVSWVPVVNFSGSHSSVFLPNIHGFVPQQPSTLRQGSSAASALPTTNNDELNLNIRKLTL